MILIGGLPSLPEPDPEPPGRRPPPAAAAADGCVCPVCSTPIGSARELVAHVPLRHGAAEFAAAAGRPDLARGGSWTWPLRRSLLAMARRSFS